MLQKIIHSLDLHPVKLRIFQKLAEIYQSNLPESLYLNPYELQSLGGSSEDWKEFLKVPEVQRFIESEIAMIAEISARHALKRLQDNPSSSDIQAAKQLLENSKLLKQKINQRQQFIITSIPKKQREEELE